MKLFFVLTFTSLVFIFIFIQSDIQGTLSVKREISKTTCGRLPQEVDITIDNVIWQVLSIPKGFYKLMNAYLDQRFNKTVVRVSVIGDRLNIETDAIYCQFWFDELSETQPIVVRATEFSSMWPDSEFCEQIFLTYICESFIRLLIL
jgi:hypothetical protein